MQEQISKGNSVGSLKLTMLAAEHGFEFTAEEAESVMNEAQGDELSDFELEIVSGGKFASQNRLTNEEIAKLGFFRSLGASPYW